MEQIKRILRLWPEFWGLPVALVLWWVSPMILHLIDATAGTYDAGIFQTVLFAFISILIINALVWLGIRFNFPVLFEYYENGAGEDYKLLTSWQKVVVLLWVYSVLLFGFVFLCRVL